MNSHRNEEIGNGVYKPCLFVSGLTSVVERKLMNKEINVTLHGWVDKMFLWILEGILFFQNDHQRKRSGIHILKGKNMECRVHKQE
jgi:hypothetical protein